LNSSGACIARDHYTIKIQKHFSVREVAEILSLSTDAVRTQIEKRRLAFNKVGGRIRIAESDLDAFMDRTRVSAHGEAIGSSKKTA
jgi:excisionase family DNA binding protein